MSVDSSTADLNYEKVKFLSQPSSYFPSPVDLCRIVHSEVFQGFSRVVVQEEWNGDNIRLEIPYLRSLVYFYISTNTYLEV